MDYLRAVLRSVLAMDMTRLRHWSALRRGALVVATMLIGTVLVDPETGALASVASLFVGLQDRNGSVSYTSRVMVAESMLLSLVVLLGGYASAARPAAWGILILAAVGAGMTAMHDKAISRMLGDVMPVAAFLGLSRMSHDRILASALAVLIAGLVQAITARAWVRIEGDLPERRPVAAALIAVADHLDDALKRERKTTGKAAEDRLTEAAEALAHSDLSHDRRRALGKLLADAEVLRQEAAGIRMRRAINVAVIDEPEVVSALGIASLALRATAAALTSVSVPGRFDAKQEASLAELFPLRKQAEIIAEDSAARPTARSIARQTLRIYRHVAGLVQAAEDRSAKRSHPVGENLMEYLTHPSPRDWVSGARLGLATVVALVTANLMDLPHGAWVAATTVALLRPDYRALTSDTVARAIGTGLGAVLVLPLVLVSGDRNWVEVFLMGVLATLAFAITTVNEGLFVVVITVQTVFTRAIVGEDPIVAATSRMLDVLVGCVIALVFLFALPLSHGRKLNQDMAAYASATATWMDAIGSLTAGQHVKGISELRRNMRYARVDVQHGLDLRIIEPLGPGLSAWRGQVVFTRIHDCARAAAAAERSLKHGDPCQSSATDLTADTAATLHLVADALMRQRLPETMTGVPDLPIASDDAISELLEFADQEAHAALDAITVVSAGRH